MRRTTFAPIFIFTTFFSINAITQTKEKPILLKPIRVTDSAEKVDRNIKDIPSTIANLQSEEILEKQNDSLQSVLTDIPGVDFTGGPRTSIQKPQIRGLGESRVLLLIDGARQNFNSSHSGNVYVDTSLLKSVDVIKGGSSALYGNNAMGGVILLKRKYADDFLIGDKNYGAQLGQSYFSADHSFTQSLTGYMKKNNYGAVIHYKLKQSNDIRLGNGEELANSASDQYSLSTNAHLNISKHNRLQFSAERFREYGEWLSNPAANMNNTSNPSADTSNTRSLYQVSHEYNPSPYLNLSTKLYSNSVDVDKQLLGGTGSSTDITTQTYGAEVTNTSSLVFSNSLLDFTYGGEFFKNINEGKLNGALNNRFADGESQHLGFYFQPSYEIPDLFRIVPGVRYDSYKITADDSSFKERSDEQVSAKLGLVYFLNKQIRLFTNYGQAYNTPQIQDLFVSGKHFGGFGPFPDNNFVVNTELKPEKSETYELGLSYEKDYKSQKFSFEMSVFQTDAEDFIVQELGNPVVIMGQSWPTTTQFLNIANVKQYGFETGLRYTNSTLDMHLNYSQVRIYDESDGESLEYVPANKYSLSIQYLFSDQLKFGTVMNYFERQKYFPASASASTTPIEAAQAYFIQDLMLSWDTKLNKNNSLGEKLSFGLKLNNIFDRDYRASTAVIKGVGRDLRLNMTLNL